MICPNCGSNAGTEARFCPACGHQLDQPGGDGEERKLVSVLFADLAGSTSLGEQLDPEELRAVLTEFFDSMRVVIESRGGTVEKFIGDAVMAVFGIPVAHEDDPQRAIAAGMEMQRRLQTLNDEVERRHGLRLAMRIGINSGEVVARAERREFMVTGDVVNVAARLEQVAAAGEILIGERTARAARQAFRLERVAAQQVRGKEAPVQAWRVLGGDVETAGFRAPGTAPLVGRRRELELLKSLYASVVEDQRPALVLLLGEAGVGKTRLIDELLATLAAEAGPPAVYRGRCLPYGSGLTYWAMRELLWGAAQITLDDSADTAGTKLGSFVTRAMVVIDADQDQVRHLTDALALTAGIELATNPLRDLSPEAVRNELGLAWPRLLGALAATRPTVVLIEDLHWAEAPLLDMVDQIVTRADGPLLVLGTGRPELGGTRPAWSGRPRISQLALEPLPAAHADALTADLLPRANDALRQRVAAIAEGNPLFVEEIARYLVDRGMQADGGSMLDTDGVGGVPDSIRGLLAARIDDLDPSLKRALQHASVVGRTFWPAALAAINPDNGGVAQLPALEEKGLIVTRPSSSLPGEPELAFRHGLIREVAYQSLPRARRAVVHAAVAEWIGRLAGARRSEFVELLAHHYEAAADPATANLAWSQEPTRRETIRAEAVRALVEAGRAARERMAVDEALAFAERALVVASDDAERLAVVELRARAAHAGVRADEAWRWYGEAIALADRLGDEPRRLRLMAEATLLWSRYQGAFSDQSWRPRAIELVEEGLRLVGADSDSYEAGTFLVGRASQVIWDVPGMALISAAQARRDLERAAEIADRIGSENLLSYALDALPFILRLDGLCDIAELSHRTLNAAHAMADRWAAHELYVTAALGFADVGDLRRAAQAAGEASQLVSRMSPHHRLHAASAEVAHLFPSGRLSELIEVTHSMPELVADEGLRACMHALRALAGSAVAAHEIGDAEGVRKALEIFDSSAKVAQGAELRFKSLEMLAPLLPVDELESWLREETTDGASAKIARLRARLWLTALHAGEPGEEELATARQLARRSCAPTLALMADWAEAVHFARSGRHSAAVDKLTDSFQALVAAGERYVAARLLVAALPHIEPARRQPLGAIVVPPLHEMGAQSTAREAESLLA